MSKFLKLTSFLLNTNDIHKIVIEPNKYFIYIATKKIYGFIPGFFSSYTSEIEVCEKKHSIDYKIVSDWINKNDL
jgi:hypothetical protein